MRIDRALGERAVEDRVELLRRLEVAAERLLDDDPGVLVDALLGEALDDVVEEARRDGEEVERVLGPLERLLQLHEGRLLAVVARHVLQPLEDGLDDLLVRCGLDGAHGIAEPLFEGALRELA